MDKLQWFKFAPSDWMMGKIQRCPEVTQARFLRLCCLYWNKECELSYEDAEIEIDDEHLSMLIRKKVICNNNSFISISFLDSQFQEINETSSEKSKSGVIGNLKRWHPAVYKRFSNKEISLSDALLLAKQSHTDNTPITEGSQSIAEKKREEEKREDKIREDKKKTVVLYPSFGDFWNLYDKKVDRKRVEPKWNKLIRIEKEVIMEYIPIYFASQPDKQYRKNPDTFLNNRAWENEIINSNGNNERKQQTSEFVQQLADDNPEL